MQEYLFILDFDGPLANSLAHYEEVHRRTFDALGRPVPFDNFSSWYNSEWEQNWLSSGFQPSELPGVFRTFATFLDYTKVSPQPFLAEQLSALKMRGRLVVGSTTAEEKIDTFLTFYGLRTYFDAIFGPRTKQSTSAKIEIFRAAMKNCEACPERMIIIGDTAADIRPAHDLGCRSVGIGYGWYGKAKLEREKPTIIVHSPDQLASAVLGLLDITSPSI